MTVGVLSACGGKLGSSFLYVNFAEENGYTFTEKKVTTSHEEYDTTDVYWEIKKDSTIVAYITSFYINQNRLGLSTGYSDIKDKGTMSLNIYVPYCDTTDFVIKVDGQVVEKGEMKFDKQWQFEALMDLHPVMPYFNVKPDAVYNKNVSISLEGLDPEIKREVEVKFLLNGSRYFALNDGTTNGKIEVKEDNISAITNLGYNMTIATELIEFGTDWLSTKTATFKLLAGDSFMYYTAINSSNMIDARGHKYIGGTKVLLSDTEDAKEGYFNYEEDFQMAFSGFNPTVRQGYKVVGTVAFDVYFMD